MLVASIMARETLQCRYVLQCGAEETVVAEVKAECDRGERNQHLNARQSAAMCNEGSGLQDQFISVGRSSNNAPPSDPCEPNLCSDLTFPSLN
ncbi:hypothetical protein KEM48_012573 [Puccinia striiformis f. sp. tritici PST-130]|nr:hypothetical protein KEM48_012573 [Puccinia striiformis f. sp. tritici PST-130]